MMLTMEFKLYVDNIKCGGCAGQITKKLSEMDNVSQVDVNIEEGCVSFETDEALFIKVKQSLVQMGYPETGSQEGIEALGSKAKSYVSCAIGRMNTHEENNS